MTAHSSEGSPVVRPASRTDLDAVLELLAAESLPADGVHEAFGGFVVAEDSGAIVGAAGTESYGTDALLRSVVVRSDQKGRGLGRRLVQEAIGQARRAGARDIYLLTTTADAWFPRFGFEIVTRADVPEPVRESVEFTSACPSTATVMRSVLAS